MIDLKIVFRIISPPRAQVPLAEPSLNARTQGAFMSDSINDMPIPAEAARRSGMKPPTDSEMISPTVPR
jgi:hypothetical protein